MLMTNQQTAKLAEPGVGSLHDPSPLIAAEFASVFVSPFMVVAPVRRNQFDAALAQPLTQRVLAAWPAIKVPALVADGDLDVLVGEDNSDGLYDALGSARKQLIIFPRNAHAWFVEDNYAATMRAFDRFLAQF